MTGIPEFVFRGEDGNSPVVVVSCPGAADETIHAGRGEIPGDLSRTRHLSVAVVYVRGEHISVFWDLWRANVRNFAHGKKFVTVVTKSNGELGNVQQDELRYLALCNGQEREGHRFPDLRDKEMIALTYHQLKAWLRVGFQEYRLGRRLPEDICNEYVDRLPSLQEMKQTFWRLARGVKEP